MNKPYSKHKEAGPSAGIPDLESIENMEGFNEAIDHDFGSAIDGFEDDGLSRRRWLQLMGASLAARKDVFPVFRNTLRRWLSSLAWPNPSCQPTTTVVRSS